MKPEEICMPNYDESILNIPNSILKHYGISIYHKSLPKLDKILEKDYKNIVFIIFDGMGSFIIDHHLPEDSIIRKNKLMDLTSVYPCTTATAITSMGSALAPVEHGWLAWQCYFKEYNKFIELFKNKDYYTKEIVSEENVAETMLGYENVLETITRETAGAIKTQTIYPAFKPDGVDTTEEMFARMVEMCKTPEKKFISIYWDQPDSMMHDHGCFNDKVNEFINTVNKQLEDSVKDLKDTLILITADHGLLDIEEYIYLNEVPEIDECLVMPTSMEGRVTSFVVKAEKREQFKEAFNRLYGENFKLFEKEEYITKLLGEGKRQYKVDDFVGDFVSVAISRKSFKYKIKNMKEPEPDKAQHAGLTAQEMLVSLIAIECEK